MLNIMNIKTTFKKILSLFVIVINMFVAISLNAQITLKHQGFDSSPIDTWGYSTTLNTGTANINSTVAPFYVSAPNSYRIGGSAANGSNDPFVLFDNVSIVGYTNIKVNIAFTSDGSVDVDDDLYLDISYDNGVTYPTQIKLFDGQSSSDNLTFIHSVTTGISVGSLYNFSVPNGNSQIKIRVRFDELNTSSNTTDYYFIDNISLTGVPTGNHITLSGLSNSILHKPVVHYKKSCSKH